MFPAGFLCNISWWPNLSFVGAWSWFGKILALLLISCLCVITVFSLLGMYTQHYLSSSFHCIPHGHWVAAFIFSIDASRFVIILEMFTVTPQSKIGPIGCVLGVLVPTEGWSLAHSKSSVIGTGTHDPNCLYITKAYYVRFREMFHELKMNRYDVFTPHDVHKYR